MASVSSHLRRIKDDLCPFLSDQAILAACQQAGHRWRERALGPVATIHLFVLQVLNFNTAMTHLRHLGKTAVKAPAYCRARMRLPLAALQTLLVQSSEAMRDACSSSDGLWCGLRPYLVDGSSTIAPDTPDSQKAFGQPKGCKAGCGFPVPKLLGLFDAFSGLMMQALGFPLYTHERVETHFAELKTLLHMRKVKSKTSEGVLKELTVYALVYNLIHLVMVKAAQRQGVEPHRISFIDTVRWLLSATPGEPLPDLLVNPHRPDRHEPRVIKDLQDTYPKMTRPRTELRKELKKKAVAAGGLK